MCKTRVGTRRLELQLTYHQEDTHRVIEFRAFAVRGLNLETTGSQDNGEGQPETTIGREGSSTESVTSSHFPTPVSIIHIIYILRI